MKTSIFAMNLKQYNIMSIIDRIYLSISIGDSRKDVLSQLNSLYLDYDNDVDVIKTERLDYKYGINCKHMYITMKDNKVVDIDESF